MTPYGAATPLCPPGYDGTGPSASLGLLDVAHGYVCACAMLGGLAVRLTESTSYVATRLGAPPCTWPRGARNAARPPWAEVP